MTTTTFNQVIREQTFRITVPVNKVEKLLDRIDFLLDQAKPRCDAKAIQLLKPYVGAPEVTKEVKTAPVKAADALVAKAEESRLLGRYRVIKLLQADFGVTYQKARAICIKAKID